VNLFFPCFVFIIKQYRGRLDRRVFMMFFYPAVLFRDEKPYSPPRGKYSVPAVDIMSIAAQPLLPLSCRRRFPWKKHIRVPPLNAKMFFPVVPKNIIFERKPFPDYSGAAASPLSYFNHASCE
jgi:hypothetical protein